MTMGAVASERQCTRPGTFEYTHRWMTKIQSKHSQHQVLRPNLLVARPVTSFAKVVNLESKTIFSLCVEPSLCIYIKMTYT